MTEDAAGRRSAPKIAADGLDDLADEVLPALIARLRASRLGELEVRTADWRVRLRRDGWAAGDPASSPAAVAPGGVASPEADGGVARSPAVGYFTPSSELVVGHSVSAGDVLGSVDVLGIGQEVTAPTDGIISSVLAEEGQAVEYGQPLAEVEPLELDTDDLSSAFDEGDEA